MKEIGKKFLKTGDIALTALTKDITSTSSDLLPAQTVESLKSEDRISLFTLNNCKVYIYSQKSAGMNLYKILNYIKPDRIFLQQRPDDVCKQNSVSVCPSQVFQNLKYYKDASSALRNSGFLLSPSNIEVKGNQSLILDRLSGQVLSLAGVWALQHNLKTLELSDLPRSLLYRKLSNSLTLMQLQSMLSHIGKLMGAQPDIFHPYEPPVPLSLAYRLYPSIWDVPSVPYLHKILNTHSSSHKKIICIATRETGQKLEQVITNELPEINYNVSLFYTSIIQKECTEMVIEKLAVIHNFFYGFSLIDCVAEHPALQFALEVIKEVVEEERKNSRYTMSNIECVNRRDLLLKLYISMLKRYSTFGKLKVEDGKKQLRAEFVKTAVRKL